MHLITGDAAAATNHDAANSTAASTRTAALTIFSFSPAGRQGVRAYRPPCATAGAVGTSLGVCIRSRASAASSRRLQHAHGGSTVKRHQQ